MARKTTTECDFCGKAIEQVAAKLYLAPVLPGKASTSFMSGYSHYSDVCEECMTIKFLPKMTRRVARSTNGNGATVKRKRKSRA